MKKHTFLLGAIFVILALIPLTLWGDYHLVRGDDSNLYYLFPYEFYANYTPKLIYDNLMGVVGSYTAQSYIAPFAGLLSFVHYLLPHVDLQFLFFGLNIAGGFISFYYLLDQFIPNKSNYIAASKIVGSLLYVLSVFSMYTIWAHHLFAVYILSIGPLITYLFIRAVKDDNSRLAIIASITMSLFSILLLSAPYFLGFFIALMPLLIYVFRQKPRKFIKMSIIFFILTILLNMHWLFHFVYAPFSSEGSNDFISNTISSSTISNDEYTVREVTRNNQLMYPLVGLFHKNIQKDFGWSSYEIFTGWHEKAAPYNAFYLIIILSAGILIHKSEKKDRAFYYTALTSWLLMLFLFTVKIGAWGTALFLFLTRHVPGFIMFRNMYDKFGIGIAFSFAFILSLSLIIVVKNIHRPIHKKILLFLVVVLIIFNAIPFIKGDFYKLPLSGTYQTFQRIRNFNTDFYELVDYINKNPSASRYLWMPLNLANYIIIRGDDNSDNTYIGVSPIQFLTNNRDYNGKMSFGVKSDEVFDTIINDDPALFGRRIQQMNVGYIIVNNDISQDIQRSYLFSADKSGDIYSKQDAAFLRSILGEKIKDFGDRYSLYNVNSKIASHALYVSKSEKIIPNDPRASLVKKDRYVFDVQLFDIEKEENLIFLEPYHEQWEFRGAKSKKILLSGPHRKAFNYANTWTINKNEVTQKLDTSDYTQNTDGTFDVDLELYFKPDTFNDFAIKVSFTTLALCIIAIIVLQVKTFQKKDDAK